MCANALPPTYGWEFERRQVGDFRDIAACLRETDGELPHSLTHSIPSLSFRLAIRETRLAVAAAFAVAVHRALHLRHAGAHCCEGARDSHVSIVVRVDAEFRRRCADLLLMHDG